MKVRLIKTRSEIGESVWRTEQQLADGNSWAYISGTVSFTQREAELRFEGVLNKMRTHEEDEVLRVEEV